ncbi:unnamed protein product [Paramecium octaurelia]|uniref:Uncharacterized protein n=1 Tax=Paramecium octaurelia TaxID=43137 RepID=A0A8S1UG28_PAROT|nr:unnamed protein product [Paramecium octaurelia]
MICLSERKISIHQNKGLIQLPEISKSSELLIEQYSFVIGQKQEENKTTIARQGHILLEITPNKQQALGQIGQLFQIIQIPIINIKNTLWGYFVRQYQEIQQTNTRYLKQTQSLYQQN